MEIAAAGNHNLLFSGLPERARPCWRLVCVILLPDMSEPP
ncbi:hypothetical protein OK016_09020 [Vibrio chagasii]|nr:hypothetical protein [Vibrio chagasii]